MIHSYSSLIKTKIMKKQSTGQKITAIFLSVFLMVGSFGTVKLVGAQSLQQQINELTQQNNNVQAQVDALEVEAESYEDTIAALRGQIAAFQKQIKLKQNEANKLQKQIEQKEIELEEQKDLLGQSIKAMYLEGDITTIEMLATSKSLSDYFDKQQYREVVKSKIKTTLDTVKALKAELQNKKTEVEKIIKQQQELKASAALQKAEQDRLLSFNQAQRNDFNAKIKKNQSKINELRTQQAIENARLFGSGGGQVGGGGYPWGHAPCLHGGQVQGYCYDYEWGYNGSYYNWSTGGYAYRNCTDYVAWRTGAPGGLGNAKSWDDRAPAYGLTVSSTPRVGAAAVSNSGYYGHVMYVEAVNGDGSIVISDYNRAGPGEYGVSTLSAGTASNLRYVYF